MKDIRKVSIVIPTYNRADFLDLTLHSVLNQTTNSVEIETIVVDDGSNDHTASVIAKYDTQFDLKYFFQEDLGNRTARARNLGISQSKGDVIIFVDSGILLKSDFTEAHVSMHRSFSHEVAVIGYVYGFDQYCSNIEDLMGYVTVEDVDGSIQKLKELKIFEDMRSTLYRNPDFRINEIPAPWALFITCNCSVSRQTLDKVGYFDTNLDLNWGVEDLELGYRIWKQRINFVVATGAMAIHFPHESDMTEKFAEEKANKEYFHKKHNSLATEAFLNCGFLELNDRIAMNSIINSL